MQKPIDHFQQPILGSHENLQLVCEIENTNSFCKSTTKKTAKYKYKCKIAKIQLNAEEGTVRDWFVFGARWLETVRTGDATLAATDARLLLDHPRYVKLVQ